MFGITSTWLSGVMARATLYLMALSLLLVCSSSDAYAGDILVGPETQYAPQGGMGTFVCVAEGHTVQWSINTKPITASNLATYESDGYVFTETEGTADTSGRNTFNLTLSIPADDKNNGTRIECVATGTGDRVARSGRANLIVMGRPSPVDLQLHYVSSTLLSIVWTPPFTWPGYGVTEYKVTVRNKTTDQIVEFLSLQPAEDASEMNLELPSPNGVMATCHQLNVYVETVTDLGSSDNAEIPVWFPIATDSCDHPQTEVLFSSEDKLSHARAKVSFNLPELCHSQVINYTFAVREEGVTVVTATLSGSHFVASDGPTIEGTLDGLERDKEYEVTVSIEHVAGGCSAVTKFRTSLNGSTEIPPVYDGVASSDETGLNMYIIVAIGGGGLVIIAIVVIAITALVAFTCRKRKPTRTTKVKSMTNPIYEGPLYETISEASQSQSSSSPVETPTVIKESPYFGNPIHPTYENGTVFQFEDITVPTRVTSTDEDSYTVMSPASKKTTVTEHRPLDPERYVKTD